jgi:nucleotide-binding universal stress UspA family protein
MQDPKHILVPVDLSDASCAGLRAAAELARRFDANVTALHVEVATAALMEVMTGDLTETSERHLERVRAEAIDFVRTTLGKDHEVRVAVVEGLAIPETIARYADEHDADWICMSAAGHSGFRRLLLGSTAAAVIRGSKVPILTVRSRTEQLEFDDFRTVLVATDLDEGGKDAILLGARLAGPEGRLTVMHVIESPPEPMAFYGAPLVIPAESLEAAREWTAGALQAQVKGVDEQRLEPFKIVTGRAAECILAAEKELEPDVTVLGTHGRHGTEHLLLGSVAERVVHHATGPVLVVPNRKRS